MYRIPFNRPYAARRELEYIQQVLENRHLSGDGEFTRRCHQILEEVTGTRALLTTSGTHALELAALLLELKPGDEVIAPSFSFSSTAGAFVLHGARPVFCDIRDDSLNIDERQVEALITSQTRAIVVVHYAGVACEMNELNRIASAHDVMVIEDNAHGLFGRYQGRALGTLSALAALSFHETKNVTSGEGGAILVNDARYLERAEILREKGTDRTKFFRGQVDKYTWCDLGSSYLPSELLAALLLSQLEDRTCIQERRQAVWERYARELADWAGARSVQLPFVPAHCEQAYHLFYLVMPDHAQRDALIRFLRERGINSVFHYVPLHNSPMGLGFGGYNGQCPVTESVSARLLRLPFFTGLTDGEQGEVIAAVQAFG